MDDTGIIETGRSPESGKEKFLLRARFLAETQRAFNPSSLHDLADKVSEQLDQHPNDVSPDVRQAFSEIPPEMRDEFVEQVAHMGYEAARKASDIVGQANDQNRDDPFEYLGIEVSTYGWDPDPTRKNVMGILFAGAFGDKIVMEDKTNNELEARINEWESRNQDRSEDIQMQLAELRNKVHYQEATVAAGVGYDEISGAVRNCLSATRELCKDRTSTVFEWR